MSESSFEVLFMRPPPPESTPTGRKYNGNNPVKDSFSGSPCSCSSLLDDSLSKIPPSVDDRTESLQSHFLYRPLTPIDRLFYRKKSRLSLIQEKVKQPDKVIPAGKLPIWDRLLLDDKLPTPNIPNHRLVWTRGKICENLHREPSFFEVGDPYNRRRVLTEPYDALHDEATKSYFQCPSVQKLLHEQGLITPNGSVPCTLTQFNNWRKYLNATIQTEKIKKGLDGIMETKAWNHEQMKLLQEFVRQDEIYKRNSHRKQRQLTARENQVKAQVEKIRKYEIRLKEKEKRMEFWKLELSRRELDRILRLSLSDQKRNSQLGDQREKEIKSRERILVGIVAKQLEGERRVKERERIKERVMEAIFENKIQAHSKVQEIENERESRVVGILGKESKEGVTARREAFHQQHLKLNQKGKKGGELEGKLGLMRKYFDKWTEYAVKRQLERCLTHHSTTFDLPATMEETLQSINQQLRINTRPKAQSGQGYEEHILDRKESRTNPQPKRVDTKERKVGQPRKTKSLVGGLKMDRPKTASSVAELEHRKKREGYVGGTMEFILAEARRMATVKNGGFKRGFQEIIPTVTTTTPPPLPPDGDGDGDGDGKSGETNWKEKYYNQNQINTSEESPPIIMEGI